MNQAQLEERLRTRLLADRRHKSRCRDNGDGTITVTPSGHAVGLAYAIGQITGEDDEVIMNRVMEGTEDPAEEQAVFGMSERRRQVAELMLYAARIEPARWHALTRAMGAGWVPPVTSNEIGEIEQMTLASLLGRV